MIKVQTSRFGEVTVEETEIVELRAGLIGFPELRRFVLLDHEPDSPFKWLQSLDDGNFAFVVINPLVFKADYSIEVSESEVADLGLENEEDAVISVIVTMPSNPQNMTANLKAPLVFNLKNRLGKQVVLSSSQYTTRHHILEEMTAHTEKEEQRKQQERSATTKSELQTAKNRKTGTIPP